MNDRIDLVLAQRALDERLVAHAALHGSDLLGKSGTDELGLGDGVANQAYDIGASRNETLHQPGADETGGARDEGRPIHPEAGIYCQIRHGALS